MPRPDPNSTLLDAMVGKYLDDCKHPVENKNPELEVRFGNIQKCTRTDYEKIVQHLINYGWETEDTKGQQMLRIYQSGDKDTRLRTEIKSSYFISEYCRTNHLQKLSTHPGATKCLMFTSKEQVLPMVSFPGYDFRVFYQTEQDYSITSTHPLIQATLNDNAWNESAKMFRNINRVRFTHPTIPVNIDLSMIKKNSTKRDPKTQREIISTARTVQEAGIFDKKKNLPTFFEIELELDNIKCTKLSTEEVLIELRKAIRFTLSGLQGTPYPITIEENNRALNDYMNCMFGTTNMKPLFVGPMSVTLQYDHLQGEPILNKQTYSVTEKADGLRCLLFVNEKGYVYLINMNLKVIFTGAIVSHKECHNSILDGELIRSGKTGILFLFAAFDIYFYGGKKKEADVRSHAFMQGTTQRLQMLKLFETQFLETISYVVKNPSCPFIFKVKAFEMAKDEESIYSACERVWNRRGTYDYEVDGLIFTPANTGVGSLKEGKTFDLTRGKFTWDRSFKWKPPHENTIDFLVKVDKRGVLFTIDERPYYTICLHCGANRKQMNQCVLEMFTNSKREDEYIATPFQPNDPYQIDAYLCYMPAVQDGLSYRMQTELGDNFDDMTIVEFRYDMTRSGPWRWVATRVRHDKTEQLREKKRNFGNDISTANSVWRSIHYTITENMIIGKEPMTVFEPEVVYYKNNDGTANRDGLRNFHNLGVKELMVMRLTDYVRKSEKVIKLIDYAVGKAGDLPKWRRAKIDYILGIDLNKKNIYEPSDGACARFFDSNAKGKNVKALFVHGDVTKNILNSDAFESLTEKDMIMHLFGKEKKESVFPFGVVKEGFHLSSCQFALHYFFQSVSTLHGFLRNVAECTALEGFVFGTCFDGEKVFKALKNKRLDESVEFAKDGVRFCSLRKEFPSAMETFQDSYKCLNMSISVFQDSIGSYNSEYLVSFPYLTECFAKYGFEPVPPEILLQLNMKSSSETFESLYEQQSKFELSEDEKKLSFLNRCFIFQKKRHVSDIQKKNILKEALEEVSEKEEPFVRKILKGRVILGDEYSPL